MLGIKRIVLADTQKRIILSRLEMVLFVFILPSTPRRLAARLYPSTQISKIFKLHWTQLVAKLCILIREMVPLYTQRRRERHMLGAIQAFAGAQNGCKKEKSLVIEAST